MSIRLMTLVWDIQFPTQAQKLIALRLADYAADAGGSVFPSRETLAAKVGCDESTVKRTLKAFRDCGLVSLIREGGSGPKDTNEWQLNVELMRLLADEQCRLVGSSKELTLEMDQPSTEDVENTENKGVTTPPLKTLRGSFDELRGSPCPLKGVTSAPQLITKHQIESPRAKSDLVLDASEGKIKTQFEITEGEIFWQPWLDHLKSKSRYDLIAAAEVAKRMTVFNSRWPKADSLLPSVGRATKAVLSETSQRMTGDRT